MRSSSRPCRSSSARLWDRFGRRRTFIWGIGLFLASSIWVGLAPDLTQVIIARAL